MQGYISYKAQQLPSTLQLLQKEKRSLELYITQNLHVRSRSSLSLDSVQATSLMQIAPSSRMTKPSGLGEMIRGSGIGSRMRLLLRGTSFPSSLIPMKLRCALSLSALPAVVSIHGTCQSLKWHTQFLSMGSSDCGLSECGSRHLRNSISTAYKVLRYVITLAQTFRAGHKCFLRRGKVAWDLV